MTCPYCKTPATLVGKITDRETGRVAIQKYQCGFPRDNSRGACGLAFLVLYVDGRQVVQEARGKTAALAAGPRDSSPRT